VFSKENRWFRLAGHLGDAVYQMYAIMISGGGGVAIPLGEDCNQEEINALVPLLSSQSYIRNIIITERRKDIQFYHDFREGYNSFRFRNFFESNELYPISTSCLKKVYLFGILRKCLPLRDCLYVIDHSHKWLYNINSNQKKYDIIVHIMNTKRLKKIDEWYHILNALCQLGYSIGWIGDDSVLEYRSDGPWDLIRTKDLLIAAQYINDCSLFIGTANVNYVIAEALDRIRLVEVANVAAGTIPRNERGYCINEWSAERIINTVKLILNKNVDYNPLEQQN